MKVLFIVCTRINTAKRDTQWICQIRAANFFMNGNVHYIVPPATVNRNVRSVLPKLKDIGDKAAHNRRWNAHRQDLDKVIPHLRDTVQELLALARLK